EEWDAVLDTNLKGLFFLSVAAARAMAARGRGKIIQIASVLGAVGDVTTAAYAASKGGVIALTRTLAVEWARYGITVNAIAPGYVPTDMNREAFANQRFIDHVLPKVPLGRFCSLEDVTGLAVFLATRHADYITGQTLYVDGGWTAS
ncbi:MAG: SDR family oxidoreductase, partial [Clostridia bacterium]|nr:SDR family oxidoreductase [Clostridia bacterium]